MIVQDVRFAWRTLAKNSGLTAIAVACLAIGIGVNAMMFAVVDGVLIQPLPYPSPDQIVLLHTTNQRAGISRGSLSPLDVRDWRERATSFSALAGVEFRSFTIGDQNDPQRFSGAAIGHELFPLLGVAPQIGRNFSPADDQPGAPAVVIVADDVWQRRYSGDRSIIGRSILVNGQPHTVIGVMPPRFAFPESQHVWLPLAEYAKLVDRSARDLQVFARLKPGTTLAQARQEADAIAGALATTYPDTNDGWGAYVRPIGDWAIGDDVRLIVKTMMGAVTLVLLIACFNVANLLLARASARAREIAIRTALGAGRLRLLRQMLTESVMLGLASVPFGVLIAWAGLKWLSAEMPPNTPYFIHWELNGRTLAYTIGVAVLASVVFGLAPAVHALKPGLQETLKEGGRGTAGVGRAWLRHTLVVAEVALSLVLLVGASLFIRSFLNLQRASGGFDTAPLMTMRFYLPVEQYPDLARTQRIQDIVRRIETLPGVSAAFASNMIPLGGGGSEDQVFVDGRTFPKDEEPDVNIATVSPHLLATLGLSIVRGRDFTDAEGRSKTAVALVNQAMAGNLWPNVDPLGRRFKRKHDPDGVWFTVVGIAPDFRQGDLDTTEPVYPAAYIPLPYETTPNTGLTIRAAGDPALIAGPAREAIRAADSTIAVFSVERMEELRKQGYWQYRLFGWMFSAWGAIALLLAAVGVYGVLSYSVTQCTQEIGVRVALGAGRADVLRLVVFQGLKLAAAGAVIGVLGAFGVTRVVASILYNVSPTDPISFIAVSLFLGGVAFLASYVPARRATAVDPLTALRSE